MATIASLNIDLRANVAKLVEGLRKSSEHVVKFSKAVSDVTARIAKSTLRVTKWAAAITTAGVAASAYFVKQQFAALDALGKTADKLGVSTEALAAYRLGAKLSGIETATLDMAFQRFTRRLGEASKGTGEAKAALKELGIDAKAVAGDPVEAFKQVADAISSTNSRTDRLRLAFKLFDSEGVALVNMLANGRAGLEEFERQAEEAGIAVSRSGVRRVEQFNDAMTILGTKLSGIAGQLAIKLAPALEDLVDWLSKVLDGMGSINDQFAIGKAAVIAFGDSVARSIDASIVFFRQTQIVVLQAGKSVIDTIIKIDRQVSEFINRIIRAPAKLSSNITSRLEKVFPWLDLSNSRELDKRFSEMAEGLITTLDEAEFLGSDTLQAFSDGLGEAIDGLENDLVNVFNSDRVANAYQDMLSGGVEQLGGHLFGQGGVLSLGGGGGMTMSQRTTAGALERGTAAAFSAGRAGGANVLNDLLGVQKEQLKIDRDLLRLALEQTRKEATLEVANL